MPRYLYHYPAPPGFLPPVEVRRLPFTLQRDALVTRDPELMEAALEAFYDDEPNRELEDPPAGPIMLPQKMQWQQWKTPPLTGYANRPTHRPPAESAASFVRALHAGCSVQELVTAARATAPVYGFERAAFDRRGNISTTGPDTSPMLMRDVPAHGRPIHPFEGTPDETYEATGEYAEEPAYEQGIEHRLQEVRALQARFVDLILSDTRGRR